MGSRALNLRNVAGFAAGPIVSASLGLVTLPLTTWVFEPADVGRLNIFQTALSFVLLVATLGLDQSYVREYHEAEDKEGLLASCFTPGFGVLLVILAISTIFAEKLSIFLFDASDPWLAWLCMLTIVVSFISRFLSLILRMEGRGWAFSASQIMPKLVQVSLIVALAISPLSKSFVNLLLIAATSALSVVLLYGWNTRRQVRSAMRKRLNGAQFQILLAYGYPLIFSGIAYWGFSSTGILALRTWSSLDELAVYSVGSSLAQVAVIFQSIFTVVWSPMVYKWVAEGVNMEIVDRVARQALAIVFGLMAICGTFSWVSDYVLPHNYLEVKQLVPCMMLSPLLYTLSAITCVGINIQRRTILSLWVTLAALFVNVLLCWALVPAYGAIGAAAANAVAFAVFL